jgi:hypothetical protein
MNEKIRLTKVLRIARERFKANFIKIEKKDEPGSFYEITDHPTTPSFFISGNRFSGWNIEKENLGNIQLFKGENKIEAPIPFFKFWELYGDK